MVSPDGGRVYAVEHGFREPTDDAVSVAEPVRQLYRLTTIDAGGRAIADVVDAPPPTSGRVGEAPNPDCAVGFDAPFLVTPDGAALYNFCGSRLQFVDPGTFRTTRTVPVGPAPVPVAGSGSAVARSADGRLFYVANGNAGTLDVVDVTRAEVVRSARLEDPAPRVGDRLGRLVSGLGELVAPTAAAKGDVTATVLSADGRSLFVSADDAGIRQVDVRDLRVTRTLGAGRRVLDLALGADGATLVALTSDRGYDLAVFDAATGRERDGVTDGAAFPEPLFPKPLFP
jgi:DNA-binding beta-propeller fold protein YncE